jgi:hypothetical protein
VLLAPYVADELVVADDWRRVGDYPGSAILESRLVAADGRTLAWVHLDRLDLLDDTWIGAKAGVDLLHSLERVDDRNLMRSVYMVVLLR